MKKGELAHLAIPKSTLVVHVTPNASRDVVLYEGGKLQVRVSVAPEDGKATAAVLALVAEALGLPKSRLTLLRGANAREKIYFIEP